MVKFEDKLCPVLGTGCIEHVCFAYGVETYKGEIFYSCRLLKCTLKIEPKKKE